MFGGGGRNPGGGGGYFGRNPYRHPQRPAAGPRPGVGVGGGVGSWKQQLLGIGAALASIAVWYTTPVSEWVTDFVLDTIPIDSDIQLGIEAKSQFDIQYPVIFHPRYTPMVQSIGNNLVQIYRKRSRQERQRQKQQQPQGYGNYFQDNYADHYNWDFAVVDADFINAFALPGGTVRVTNKLLDTLHLTNGEVAALLGHEIGHVIHRHSQARMLQKQLLQRIVQAFVVGGPQNDGGGGFGGGGTASSRRHSSSGMRHQQASFGQTLGELLTQSAAWLGEQRFSRRDEYQADETSWDLLYDSSLLYSDYSSSSSKTNPFYYNPQSLETMLSKLSRLEDQHDAYPNDKLAQKVIEWSRTHPATKDRIAALKEKWNNIPTKEKRRLSKVPI